MKITKHQLAALLRGVEATWLSSAAYEGNPSALTEASLMRVAAEAVANSPEDEYEVPPERGEAG